MCIAYLFTINFIYLLLIYLFITLQTSEHKWQQKHIREIKWERLQDLKVSWQQLPIYLLLTIKLIAITYIYTTIKLYEWGSLLQGIKKCTTI